MQSFQDTCHCVWHNLSGHSVLVAEMCTYLQAPPVVHQIGPGVGRQIVPEVGRQTALQIK